MISSLLAGLLCAAPVPVDVAAPDFHRDVRPILSDRCFPCHGPDTASNKAGLRLDTPEGAFGPLSRSTGRAFMSGDVDASVALRRIRSVDPDERMPPPESKLELSAAEVATLEAWVRAGADYPPHWSLTPPRRSAPPTDDTGWSRDPLDHFVRAQMVKHGLAPAPEADRERWLRRVTLDLTGLPPTIAAIDAFLGDASSNAHAKVVTRLLDSTAFGEHLATPWLDVARYADSYGYQSDQLSPTWPYRDWVVRAFNENLPYDDFVTWQLAGDLLPNPTREQRLATAFNRLHRMTNEGGSIEAEYRTEYAADRVHTFGTAFLGLTFECARCHDHKFDPIPQRDYYRLFAFFNSIDEWGMYHDSGRVPTPSLLLPTPAQATSVARAETALAALDAEIERLEATLDDRFDAWRAADAEIDVEIEAPTPVGHYPLDARGEKNSLANLTGGAAGSTSPANQLVDGRRGRALEFTGDDGANFPKVAGALRPWEPFTIAFWLWVPGELDDCVIFHRTGGTDVGRFGTELVLRDGRLRLSTMRFWPGNAISILADEALPKKQWVHVTARSEGLGIARGLSLFVDGEPHATSIYRDRLTKAPRAGGSGVTFGERFRDLGFSAGRLDELLVFDRALSGVEVASLIHPEVLDIDDPVRLRDHYRRVVDPELRARHDARRQLLENYYATRDPVREISIMEELADPRPAHLLDRGAYDAPRNESTRVERVTPSALPPSSPDHPKNRLGLARWLLDDDHPLTSRVAVNRLWQHFFGVGLVATSEDFGSQGSRPSHPQLLDNLALEFAESGWDVKAFCRRLVLSATYRQTSAQTSAQSPASFERDPENRWLSRGPSRRLSAEVLRDVALAAAGLLDDARGGPPVSPYQPPGLWREANSMSPGYRQSTGRALHRRSLYSVWKRTAPLPNMTLLDAAHRESCVTRRRPTNTPLQALVLLNDIQFVEAARCLGERMLKEATNDGERVNLGFRWLTGRRPSDVERAILAEAFAEERERFRASPDEAKKLATAGESPPAEGLDPVDVAAATIIAQTILNLDATVWSR